MSDIFKLIWQAVIELFRSKASLEMEILTLRHQLNVLRRSSPKRSTFTNIDRLVFAALYRLVPRVVNSLVIVEPETVIGWHRAGFRLFWRWKSRCRDGRPKVPFEIRQLIRDMSLANPFWGCPPGSRRSTQAWHRRRANLSRQVYGKAAATSISRLEDISPQPRRCDCIDRLVCGSDNLILATVWIADSTARSTPHIMARSDGPPDRRMDCPPAHRSLRLGGCTEIHHPRSGPGLRRGIHPASSRGGHS
jgi:hypothetical protein